MAITLFDDLASDYTFPSPTFSSIKVTVYKQHKPEHFTTLFRVEYQFPAEKYYTDITISDQLLIQHHKDDIAADVAKQSIFHLMKSDLQISKQTEKDLWNAVFHLLTDKSINTVSVPFVDPVVFDNTKFVPTKGFAPAPLDYGISNLVDVLPDINKIVPFPCNCSRSSVPNALRDELKTVVIHLNDTHKWKREKIADWLDRLHDEGVINIEF